MSAFWGRISSERRRELFLKLCDLLGETPGRVLVQPVSADDVEKRQVFQRIPKKGTGKRECKPWPEPGAPRPTILKL